MTSEGKDSSVRHRKKVKSPQRQQLQGSKNISSDEREPIQTQDNANSQDFDEITAEDLYLFLRALWFLVGIFMVVCVGYYFAWYVKQLHENQMWFTNIQEVEQEISLRTECGLYYSYYKQLLKAPSLIVGIRNLMHDNATEHGRTINVLQRMNIYQEVVLAFLYKLFGVSIPPIWFYIYSIFKLNGFFISSIFVCSWYLSGSWLSGLLAVILFTLNLQDTTRVYFSINLRENFAMPFFASQLLFSCRYLERPFAQSQGPSKLTLFMVALFSFLFSICWQFNQFLLLLQTFTLYGLFVLQLAPWNLVRNLLMANGLAIFLAAVLQFFQPMVLGGILMCFIPCAVLMIYLQRNFALTGGILEGSFRIIFQVFLVLLPAFALNYVLKKFLHIDADQHIFKFLRAKFGFGAKAIDFESRIYLCHGAFSFLETQFFWRTTFNFLFPPYFLMLVGSLFVIGKNLLLEWCAPLLPSEWRKLAKNPADLSDKPFFFNQRPNLAFLVIESVFAGFVALTTLRVKYFWTLHMCILAPVLFSDNEIWENILFFIPKLKKRPFLLSAVSTTATIVLILLAGHRLSTRVNSELSDLQEFYDPDTVQLMYWIGNNTEPDAAFGGSMQLLAGVKACTGRHLLNHPHFEDKWLRDRTKRIYQIYARRAPSEVHAILKAEGADYIILEDSICLAKSDNCRTPDLMDLDNGHVPDNGFSYPGLKKTETPRFCYQIRHNHTEYTNYFNLTMQNRTFRVYKVL